MSQDSQYSFTLKVFLVRTISPNIQKSTGIGIIAAAINPKREFPQLRPKASYIASPANGSKLPMSDCNTVFAAIAETV
ncbi:hypothetical protein N7456_000001 [Penicillium angulare]|uniref:Uncharacterized protein n=1 Tax=Penicillium angulare TaxID=116970 RepID=A0A9W9KRH3_9EURO|nr:hypothetical protein N7456_000001 [Penicillium angulare]